MLVISQKPGDKIALGNGITISILDVKSGKVRLGIDAPRDVKIQRSVQKENSEKKTDK